MSRRCARRGFRCRNPLPTGSGSTWTRVNCRRRCTLSPRVDTCDRARSLRFAADAGVWAEEGLGMPVEAPTVLADLDRLDLSRGLNHHPRLPVAVRRLP